MHYRTCVEYERSDQYWERMYQHQWKPVVRTEYLLWLAAENVQRFLTGWIDIVVRY